MSPTLRADEALTCTCGHYVGRTARAIRVGDRLDASSFTDLQGSPLRSGDPGAGALGDQFGICRCGAWWARFGSLHTVEGWKPELTAVAAEAAACVVGPRECPHVVRHGRLPEAEVLSTG